MAHLTNLTQQMKIQADRMRLQSRTKWTSEGPAHGLGSTDHGQPSQIERLRRGHDLKRNVSNKKNRPPTANRPSAPGKDTAPSTPSRIPVRKSVPVMSTLKGKPKPSMSAVKGKHLPGNKHTLENQGNRGVRPPDYTWHKAGRIQELRIRYIARKFVKLWVAACFGKVGPDKIRAHYRKQLLRRAWREWHDVWWVNRREWRLQVRAQYHYRYCMTRKVWQAWVQYVVRQRIVNAKTNVADIHANTKILQNTFVAWKQYTSYRDMKKRNYGNAYRIADTRRLAQAWQHWRSQIQRLQDRDDMHRHALQHWAEGLIFKSWMKWKTRLSHITEMKRKEELAIETYHRSLLARCFYQGFMPYVLHRRDRRQDKGIASQFYISHLTQSSFHHWHTLWFTRRSLALLGQQIDAMAHTARLRRVWIHWQFYIHLKHVEAEKTAQANRFYQRRLLNQGIHAFKTAVALRKLQDIRKQKADEMRYSMLLRWSWSTWLQGCEHKEELRLYVQSRKARNHYKHVILSQVIQGWLQYTRWRQHRQAQYIKADAHHVSRLLPKCLHRIQVFAQMMRDKRYNQEQAVLFRRECLLGLCFARWYHSYHTSLDVRMMERMAIMHYDHNVAQRMLITWKQQTQLQLQDHAKEDMAEEHYQIQLTKSSIQTWKTFTAESIKSQTQEYKAARHHYLCMLRKGWQAWTQFVSHQKIKSSKLMKADVHYQHRLLSLTLDAWKVYIGRMKQVYVVVKEKEHGHNLVTLRWTFARWSENARLQCEDRRHLVLAEDHNRTILLRKVVVCWRQYAILHAHKQSQKMDRLMQIRAQLDKGKRHRVFQAWRSYKDAALLQHLAETRAKSHYQRKLLHKTLQQWVQYRRLEIRKTLLQRQCAWLHNTRIMAKYFLVWRAQHHAALAEHNKTNIALWQWSLVLQQKVLNAWVQYVAQQRHKKQRIAVAMEMRRQRLLRDGAGQWLRVATDMADRREKKAAHQHAQTAYRSYNIVRRCAHHWRQKTLANRHKRSHGIQLHPTSSLQKPNPPVVRIVTGSVAFQPIDPKLPSQPQPSMMVPAVAHRASRSVKQQFTKVEFQESSRSRPKPRRPDFLMESLQREGLWKSMASQPSDIHPFPRAEEVATEAPASPTYVDEDAIDESLPRTQPPPPPSPQPKRLVQSNNESQLKDHSKRRLQQIDESPQTMAQPTLSNKQQMSQDFEERSTFKMDKVPLLLPPSAFTAAKTDFGTRLSNAPQSSDQLDALYSKSKIGPTDLQIHSKSTKDTEIGDAVQAAGWSSPNHVLPVDIVDSDVSTSAASRNHHLLSPDAFVSKDYTDNAGDGVSETGVSEENVDEASEVLGEDDIYQEILELKNQLLQYQQAKQRLKSLKEQYKHLKSWLKELEELEGNTEMQKSEDEDAVSVRQEVAQMEVEMAELMSELDRRKPECVQILGKINVLASQIQ